MRSTSATTASRIFSGSPYCVRRPETPPLPSNNSMRDSWISLPPIGPAFAPAAARRKPCNAVVAARSASARVAPGRSRPIRLSQ
jgi:hypothetical protein